MKFWTKNDYEMLKEALLEHGPNYDRLCEKLPYFTRMKVISKVNDIVNGRSRSLPKDICDLRCSHRKKWSKAEDRKFREAILKSDFDWETVWKSVETRTMA